MKRLLLLAIIPLALVSCGGDDSRDVCVDKSVYDIEFPTLAEIAAHTYFC